MLHIKPFDQLTPFELYDIMQARSEVFVVEQQCLYQDLDGDDKPSLHVWITEGDKVMAVCRVCPAGVHLSNISIGRVVTTVRGKGYGLKLMLCAIEAAQEHYGARLIDIEAQEYARGFYEKAGFRQTSEPFMLDGIRHIKMTWEK